jgi:2'-5' RNA ligase
VAVWPPDEVLDRVAALDRPAVPGLRWTTRDQWHITLRFLGEVPEVEPVVEALAEAEAELLTAQAVLGPALDRFGRGVLHVPVTGLDELAGAVVRATSHLGRPPEDRPFAGHLTLARVAKGAPVDLRRLLGMPVKGEWKVDSVCLVESRSTRGGRSYDSFEKFFLSNCLELPKRDSPDHQGRPNRLGGRTP